MKKSKLLLVSLIIVVAYLIYSASYWSGAVSGTEGSEAAGAAIASVLVMPHLICTGIGALFNALGFFMNKRAFALVAGILYSVAMVLFPPYFFFVLIEAVLCYVAYAKMKPKEEVAVEA